MLMKMDAADSAVISSGIVFPGSLRNPQSLVYGTIPGLKILPIVGMAGIGKTTLAKEIFHHPENRNFFECYAWVTVGPNCSQERITRSILRQIDPDSDEIVEEECVRSRVRKMLSAGRRYLIVLDDVWESRLWRDLRDLFDQINFKKRVHCGVMLTTRLQDVALGASNFSDKAIQMPFLNKEESWDLFRRKVFEKMPCNYELEEAGKKIAEKCDGLPLTILTVASILSRDDQRKTPEHWNKIAEKTKHPVFMDAYDQIYEVLYPSYEHLPSVPLKECFLYMGVFPLKHEIRTSKLIKLWSVENFLELHFSKTSAQVAVECLEDLHSRSLVLNLQESANGGIKTCRLHSVFWYFCYKLGQEEKIFMALDSYDDCLVEDMERQHRLSFYNNVLFGIIDLRSLIDPVSPVRSLLCFGPYLQYEVPICSHLSFLRVVDALSIRFYDFPIEVVELDQLRYLALTCNGDLPPTISKLKFLEYLIVLRHQSVKSSGASTYLLPMEVWDMKELKHLQVTGSNLPDPDSQDKLLPNLLALLDVGVRSCTKIVLKRIPNLEKLGIRIELAPDGPSSSSFGNDIFCLEKLTSLKYVIVNPTLNAPPPFPNLPLGLKKLSLSGFGYPWEEMSKIASLPNLQVLKLRCYAFRGPRWKSHGIYGNYEDCEFKKLKYLLIEDTDLVDWIALCGSFPHIGRIILKDCYRLKEIPLGFWGGVRVDLVDCNPSAAKFNNQLFTPVRSRNVRATNSWEKKR